MERKNSIKIKAVSILIIILYVVGIVGHTIPQLRNLMLLLTPYTLLVSGVIVSAASISNKDVKLILWMITAYAFTFTMEVIGVKTGFVFGSYNYGDTLGLKLFDVPMIIGFNWILIILGAISIARSIEKNAFTTAMLAAVLAVIFDLMLEPVAIKLNYWNWPNGGIPLRNYYTWFAIAFACSYFFEKFRIDLSGKLFRFYFIVQLIFFILLSLFME